MLIKRNPNFCLLSLSFVAMLILLPGCGKTQLNSNWRQCQINIDGKYTDWKGAESYYDERAKVLLNLLNDREFLYICLITRNRQVEASLMESGFVAWFDHEGGYSKGFGILFPTGLRRMGISLEEKRDMASDWKDQQDLSEIIDREKEKWSDKNFNKRLEELEGLQSSLEIIDGKEGSGNKESRLKPPGRNRDNGFSHGMPGHDRNHNKVLSLEDAAKIGIEAKVGRENDYFVYELKIPLVKAEAYPYAIEAKRGQPIGLGLEVSMHGMATGGKSEPASGMRPGMISGRSFYLWATVTLREEG